MTDDPARPRSAASWMERWQVPLYLTALALGASVGLLIPGLSRPAELSISPVLALLLYATFLGVPLAGIGRALRDWRFLVTIFAVNFLLVPLVVFALTRVVAHDRVLLVGVLFVLLTPCIDYVIVFCGLAGGAKDRLLATTPLLMIAQMLLLPLYLRLFVGPEFAEAVNLGPFVEAFALLIALPLAAAWLTQFAAVRAHAGRVWQGAVTRSMVPLMALTLALVVASQIASVGVRIGSLLLVVPVYVAFAAVMVPVGAIAGRIGGVDRAGRRAIVFSGVTRNSLVVLPLVLALPSAFDLAPLVVVTQTLVELVVMVILVSVYGRSTSRRALAPTDKE